MGDEGKLLKVCKCNSLVHMECIREWQKRTTNWTNVQRCEACHYDLRFDGGYDNIGTFSKYMKVAKAHIQSSILDQTVPASHFKMNNQVNRKPEEGPMHDQRYQNLPHGSRITREW
jgi:hypothetical protein